MLFLFRVHPRLSFRMDHRPSFRVLHLECITILHLECITILHLECITVLYLECIAVLYLECITVFNLRVDRSPLFRMHHCPSFGVLFYITEVCTHHFYYSCVVSLYFLHLCGVCVLYCTMDIVIAWYPVLCRCEKCSYMLKPIQLNHTLTSCFNAMLHFVLFSAYSTEPNRTIHT